MDLKTPLKPEQSCRRIRLQRHWSTGMCVLLKRRGANSLSRKRKKKKN